MCGNQHVHHAYCNGDCEKRFIGQCIAEKSVKTIPTDDEICVIPDSLKIHSIIEQISFSSSLINKYKQQTILLMEQE